MSQDFTYSKLKSSQTTLLGFFDFDGDNDLDMLCEFYQGSIAGELWWIENSGNNTFSSIHFPAYTYPTVASYLTDKTMVMDIDSDNDLDILAQSGTVSGWNNVVTYNQFTLLLNDGQGNFSAHYTNENIHSFDVADLDDDGVAEIYATYNKDIIRYDWTGSGFISTLKYTAPSNGYSDRLTEVTCVDINNDGQLDIAFIYDDIGNGEASQDYIQAIYNTSSDIWTANTLSSGLTGSNGLYHYENLTVLEFADSDNDGDMDLYFNPLGNNGIVSGSNELHMKLNNGNGTFGSFCTAPVNGFEMNTSYNEIVDLDNNDIPDLLNKLNNPTYSDSRMLYRNVACSYNSTGEFNYVTSAADYNNDGNADLYKAFYYQYPDFTEALYRVSVEQGDGLGNFTTAEDSLVIASNNASYSVGLPAADFDNNGTTDLFAFDGNTYRQFNTDLDGLVKSMPATGQFAQTYADQFYAFADMNNNGFKDVVYIARDAGAIYNYARDVYVISNVGGTLSSSSILVFDNTTNATNSYTRGFAVTNTDNDTDQDILIYHKHLSQNDGKVYLVRNQGNFSFAAATAVTGNFGNDSDAELKILDLEGDGDKDFFMFGSFYRNNGNNNFTLLATAPVLCESCALEDYDGDGDIDIVTKEPGDYYSIHFYRNNGGLSFSLEQTIAAGVNGSKVEVFDFDNDGLPEFRIDDAVFKRVDNAFVEYFTITYSFQGYSSLPDGRTVSWIGDYYDMAISYDFMDAMSCAGIVPVINEIDDILTVTPTGTNYQWIDCNSGLPVDGANSASYSPASEGSYSVEYLYDECEVASNCQSVTFVVGDFDGDNIINTNDLLILLANYGCSNEVCIGDIDNDGITGSMDIAIFLGLMTE